MAVLRDAALKSKKPFDYDREVDGIRALDRYTLQFKLDEPRPRFLHLLALGDLYGALAREVVEAYGDEFLASGRHRPFRRAEWRRSARIGSRAILHFGKCFTRRAQFDERKPGSCCSASRRPAEDRSSRDFDHEEQQPRGCVF